MGAAQDLTVPATVRGAVDVFEDLFGDAGTQLTAYLQREASQRAGGNIDLVDDKINDAFQEYIDQADLSDLEPLLREVRIDELGAAAAQHETYVTDVVSASQEVAEAFLADRGIVIDEDVAAVYDDRYSGGRYNWGAQSVHVGAATHLPFNPSLLGIMVHEMAHVAQLEEKVRNGVTQFNTLLEETPVPTDLTPITEEDAEYKAYGVLMADAGNRIETLFDRAADAYENGESVGDYLTAAVTHEAAQVEAALAAIKTDPWELEAQQETIGPLFTEAEEALPHLLYLDVEGRLTDTSYWDMYLDHVTATYTNANQIEQEMRRLQRGDEVLFPGGGPAAAAGFADAVERLESAGIAVDAPHPGDVFFRPMVLDAGDTEAEYVRGTDGIVIYLEDDRLFGSTLEHELLHFSQVRAAIGPPEDQFYESLTALRETVEELRQTDSGIVEALLPDGQVATNRDVNLVSALYAFTGDVETVYAVGDAHADDVVEQIMAHEAYDQDQHYDVMTPIMERSRQVNMLPIDSYGEADALFWSLYEACHTTGDAVAPSDLYEKLYERWDDPDQMSLAESLTHYDGDDAVYSPIILDGIESRIETYGQLQEQYDGDAAAAQIINNGINRFERVGRIIEEHQP